MQICADNMCCVSSLAIRVLVCVFVIFTAQEQCRWYVYVNVNGDPKGMYRAKERDATVMTEREVK